MHLLRFSKMLKSKGGRDYESQVTRQDQYGTYTITISGSTTTARPVDPDE